MAYVATKSKFHVALNGNGLILQGAPDRLAYEMKQAPIYGNRFAQGDRDYGDFSFWWFWTQTDWSGGLKEQGDWADDAMHKETRNVDAFTKSGELKLQLKPQGQSTSFTNIEKISVGTFGTVSTTSANETAFYVATRAVTVDASNGAAVWKSTDQGDTWTRIIHAVNADSIRDLFFVQDSSKNRFLIAVGNKKVWKWDGVTATDITANVGSQFFGAGAYNILTGKAYVTDQILGTPHLRSSSDVFATAGSDAITFPFGNNPADITYFNSKVYYLSVDGGVSGTTQLRTWDDTTDVLIYTFYGKTPVTGTDEKNVALRVVGNLLLIYFDDGSVWSCTTAHVLTEIFSNVNSITPNSTGAFIFGNKAFGQNLIIKNDTTQLFFNGRRNEDDTGFMIPLATNGTTQLFKSSSGNLTKVYRTVSGTFYASGYVITNEFADVPTIDKLFYDVILNFAALASGESIEVEYSTNGGSTYTSLGTASFSVDGAITNKNFLFGDTTISKTMILRITLSGGGTTTPTVKDYSVRFVPIITTKKLWNLNINCGDEVKRLDGGLVATVGRELKGILEGAWWTKSILDFQDLDYATTLLNGALTISATTITVDDTYDFPEQGRIRIENEEIIYTGKTPTTFTGCTRASRETKAAAHSDNAVVNNAFKVILTDLQYRVPVALEDKGLEYTIGISLREV